MKDIVLKLVEAIKTMVGEEISTCELISKVYNVEFSENGFVNDEINIGFDELFDIDYELIKEAKKQGYILDSSKYDNCVVGLPFHIQFVIRKKRGKKI